jgi:hypothetical protein
MAPANAAVSYREIDGVVNPWVESPVGQSVSE